MDSSKTKAGDFEAIVDAALQKAHDAGADMAITGYGDARKAVLDAHAVVVAERDAAVEKNKRCVCLYCGSVEILKDGSTSEILLVMLLHAATCEKHPIWKLAQQESELAAAKAEIQKWLTLS